MAYEYRGEEVPRFSSVLTQLDKDGALNAKQLGEAIEIGDAYPKYSRSEMSVTQLSMLFHAQIDGTQPRVIQAAVLQFLCQGTPWSFAMARDPVTNDSDIDTRHAFDQAISASTVLAEVLGAHRATDKAGFKVDAEELAVIQAHLDLAQKKLDVARRAAQLLAKNASSSALTT